MPNIYLRLPLSRCQFFRHRESDYILQHEEPVVFNAYTHEYFIMRNSLINAAKNTHVDMACFSQQQWCNMLTGKGPAGGKVMMPRDANDWLYRRLLKSGMKPQDARGILPLDTYTVVAYTYNLSEWKHILDLRFRETTGKAHPNAKEVGFWIHHLIITRMRVIDPSFEC